ncbi:hypothetical protein Fleli_0936 [Bernardetia litoralis DSM 6794]|uniref:Uncharacterized protein n=1 Tax=Bernardetia litoralis (strain ATCC 23117 / DSM 6794 / NBRC 15988 / NCIMB 1366 / Fx l1 / Sio-4) TaxID=880071 RepID=I4AHF5_BERLS|nr:hypothetical protein [Bernardetia litoralis]AFM03390.1 hypothetical protein Fleli_0936 [Bernardetia litoralis DSM 6794]
MTPEETNLIKETVEYTKEAAKFAKETGITPVVKAASKEVFSYLGGLLTRKSQKDAVKAIEENPTDEKAAAKLEVVLESAIEDEEIEISALKAEIEKFKTLLAEHQPTANSNVQARISDSKNVISNSNIGNIGGSFRVGDNNGK